MDFRHILVALAFVLIGFAIGARKPGLIPVIGVG